MLNQNKNEILKKIMQKGRLALAMTGIVLAIGCGKKEESNPVITIVPDQTKEIVVPETIEVTPESESIEAKLEIDPIVKVDYSVLNEVSITSEVPMKEVEGWILDETKQMMKKSFDESFDGVVTIQFEENSKCIYNDTEVQVQLEVDKTLDQPKVSYSTTEPTNQDVTVTVKVNEEIQVIDGWKLAKDKQSLHKTFSENGEQTITLRDKVNNERTITVKVPNIDREIEAPVVTYSAPVFSYNDQGAIIASNVAAYINSKEPIVIKQDGWVTPDGGITWYKNFIANLSENVLVTDKAGNQVQVAVHVTKIDNEGPIINVSYEEKEDSVVVTLKSNEKVNAIAGWNLSEDQMTLQQKFTQNIGEKIVRVTDLLGNETSVTYIVNQVPEKKVSSSSSKSSKSSGSSSSSNGGNNNGNTGGGNTGGGSNPSEPSKPSEPPKEDNSKPGSGDEDGNNDSNDYEEDVPEMLASIELNLLRQWKNYLNELNQTAITEELQMTHRI